jgi:hypothetical protein
VYNGSASMKLIPEICQDISTALFFGYGVSCFFSRKMIAEFDRYRLAGQRVLTGLLQIAGAIGLVVGHFDRPILLLSSGGLALMMLLAVITRFRIQDPLYAAIPAFSLFVLNAYIFGAAL